jgi:hypothetical protein
MFEKFSELAERTAVRASRRQVLGHLGRGAMALAAFAAGLLARPGESEAAVACGPGSQTYCQGSAQGAGCMIGTTAGICTGAPRCTCVPVQGPRPGRGRRGGR